MVETGNNFRALTAKEIWPLSNASIQRFSTKMEPIPESGCWIWNGYIDHYGYGIVKINTRIYKAHRVAYFLHFGSLDTTLTIDHLCRVRCCVNPHHLEAVTNYENIKRGKWITGKKEKKYCVHGHLRNEDNIIHTKDGRKRCKTCTRNRHK